MLRLIMTWHIREGKEAELQEFVSGELIKDSEAEIRQIMARQ